MIGPFKERKIKLTIRLKKGTQTRRRLWKLTFSRKNSLMSVSNNKARLPQRSNAILTGQIPTALADRVVPAEPEPERIMEETGTWTLIDRNEDPLRRVETPGRLADNGSELVVDHVRQDMMEVEKMLTRRKELILREEEEEVQQPKKVLNALDRLSQREHFHFELPEREKSLRALQETGRNRGHLSRTRKLCWLGV